MNNERKFEQLAHEFAEDEIYIADAHIYFKGDAADVETVYRQLQEICFQNDTELYVDAKIVLRDEDGNDIDSFVE
jgi:hypothetical protein